MKAIIFGINGQDGYYLSQLLTLQGIEVFGISRTNADYIGSVENFDFVNGFIKKIKPDFIFHLAANSSTRHDIIFENHQTISTGTINILESVKNISPNIRVFLSGSGLQFKNEGLPISEENEFEASSPYSVARIQSIYMSRYYRARFGIKIYVGYFFNHDSSLRSEKHLNQKIVQTAKRIASGSKERLIIGSLDSRKEFNFAGDIVKAVWKLINQDYEYEAVIGCGKAYSVGEWVDYCFKKLNMRWMDHVDIDPAFLAEYNILVSDPKKIFNMGWKPLVDFKGLGNLMMDGTI